MNIKLKSAIAAVLSCAITSVAAQQQANLISKVYTSDADFDEGKAVNLNHNTVANQLQLNANLTTFPYIWIALSDKGTVVKVDTETGKILGEYYTAPDWRGRNPSRTTVDQNGNVWVGNRNEAEGGVGSVTHIGLSENFQCVDRNDNGQIDTSTGLGDVKPWTNKDGTDNQGGVSTAEDECILHYVRAGNGGTRSVSITPDNNVWVAGINNARQFARVNSATGEVIETVPLDCGGYGGLVDKNGILWSADYPQHKLLRYDPATKQAQCLPAHESYGLAIDTQGNIWNCRGFDNLAVKIASDGTELLKAVQKSGQNVCRGLAVNPADNHVWVANSHSSHVTRFDNEGNELAVINLNRDEGWGPNHDKGWQPTGVAIDARGKVWITNLDSDNAMRIDPATNMVDLVVDLGAGAGPYNYSDMTGTIALGNTDPQGRWMTVYDSNQMGTTWKTISWISQDNGGKVIVRARAADTQASFGKLAFVEVANGAETNLISYGRFLQLEVILKPAVDGKSPSVEEVSVTGIGTGEVPSAQPVITAKTIELCTAIDGSGSITDPAHGGDPLNFQKQLDGLANAIQDSAVFPKDGTVTISVVQFSGTPQLEVPPTLIDSQATADAVATKVRGIQQVPTSGTNIGGAITFCTDQFKFTFEKQIIDVSTDGQSDASTAASNAIAKGVDAINALGVGTGVDQAQLNAMVRPQPICTTTGQTNCGFVSLIRNFDQYAAAIKRKITMETGGIYVVEAGECGNTKEANYTVPLGPTGFYVVEAALPTDQPPGVWSLLVDTMSHAPLRSREQAIPYPGGWYGGVVLRENGLSPSWVGFSLAKSEAVEITATDFLKNLPAFTLEVVKKVGMDRWQSVFKQESAAPEQVYTTPTLARGFYAVVVTGTALSPRGRLGFYVNGKSLYGAVTGGWIDHLDGGYSAFFVQSAQKTADLKLLFCDSYGEAGAGQPAVQMLYVKEDGTKEVFWKAQ